MAQHRPIPPHWRRVLDQRGINSIRQLSHRAGVSQPAVNAVVMGDARMPKRSTLSAIAGALQLPLSRIYELAGIPADHVGEWDPPEEANRMDNRQRRAVEELIRAMVEPAEKTNVVPLRRDQHPERDGLDLAAHQGHGAYQDPQTTEEDTSQDDGV